MPTPEVPYTPVGVAEAVTCKEPTEDAPEDTPTKATVMADNPTALNGAPPKGSWLNTTYRYAIRNRAFDASFTGIVSENVPAVILCDEKVCTLMALFV